MSPLHVTQTDVRRDRRRGQRGAAAAVEFGSGCDVDPPRPCRGHVTVLNACTMPRTKHAKPREHDYVVGVHSDAGKPDIADSVRVFLLDDHELVRRGVAELLGAEPDIEVTGEAGSVAQALAAAEAAKPDVALLDVRLPDGSGIEVCRELKSRMPHLGCLMLTSFSDDDALFGAIMAGSFTLTTIGYSGAAWAVGQAALRAF